MKNNSTDFREEEISFGEQARDFVVELVKVVLISLAIIIPVRYFLIQPFYVKGQSMEPTFMDHEYLIIDEISYRLGEPARGDVVVFRYPNNPSEFFIKRIIGLPGEKIKIEKGDIYIKKQSEGGWRIIEESRYLDSNVATKAPATKDNEWVIGLNEYFVLGDNRGSSKDSREFGKVEKKLLIGKVWFRGWPFNRATFFERPDYNF